VQSITAPDAYTVVVTLKHPQAGWTYTLALTGGVFEKKFQQQHGTAVGQPGVFVMATGPYEIARFDPTSGVELSANPHYWGWLCTDRHSRSWPATCHM
jgi:ABC-type oligopeptide transport system substrate-binding subunit